MAELPACSGKEAVRAFERLGYHQDKQKSSHVWMKMAGHTSLSVPLRDPVAKGTLGTLIKASGFSREKFIDAL